MPAGQSLEERLTAVERAVAELQQRLTAPPADWVKRVTGSLKDEPAFEQVLEHGRAFRHADRPPEDGA
jgi:hypothetical protein